MKFVRCCVFLLLFCTFMGCDLFNAPTDPDFLAKIDAEIAWANAPWVPLRIDTGGMGTANPAGPQPQVVKMGYSFFLFFEPSRDYPFIGWQAWVEGEGIRARWRPGEETGSERVRFVPQNETGTEVEIFVYELPPEGRQLIIGPWGADSAGLRVYLEGGGLGTVFPAGELSGIRQNYPFTISFQPSPEFAFRGWQAVFAGEQGIVSRWETGSGAQTALGIVWEPRNASGTEMSVTIADLPAGFPAGGQLFILPIDGDSSTIPVMVTVPGSWGTVFPPVIFARTHFPFEISFNTSGQYEFRGWKIQEAGSGTVSVWQSGDGIVEREGIQWQPRNASGTEMIVTIHELPSGFDPQAGAVMLLPLDSDNPMRDMRIEAGERGSFSPAGVISRMQSFPLAIEFAPSAAWAFVEWRAYLGSVDSTTRLDAGYVTFADAASERTTVRVESALHTEGTIVLVPFCEERTQVIQANPPLINSGFFYTRSQQITIWFSMEMEYADGQEIAFAEDGIMLRGHRISDGQVWDGR